MWFIFTKYVNFYYTKETHQTYWDSYFIAFKKKSLLYLLGNYGFRFL